MTIGLFAGRFISYFPGASAKALFGVSAAQSALFVVLGNKHLMGEDLKELDTVKRIASALFIGMGIAMAAKSLLPGKVSLSYFAGFRLLCLQGGVVLVDWVFSSSIRSEIDDIQNYYEWYCDKQKHKDLTHFQQCFLNLVFSENHFIKITFEDNKSFFSLTKEELESEKKLYQYLTDDEKNNVQPYGLKLKRPIKHTFNHEIIQQFNKALVLKKIDRV